jgi:hypothetical protein
MTSRLWPAAGDSAPVDRGFARARYADTGDVALPDSAQLDAPGMQRLTVGGHRRMVEVGIRPPAHDSDCHRPPLPRPESVLEVADSTVVRDRSALDTYARAGIPDGWPIDAPAKSVTLVHDAAPLLGDGPTGTVVYLLATV